MLEFCATLTWQQLPGMSDFYITVDLREEVRDPDSKGSVGRIHYVVGRSHLAADPMEELRDANCWARGRPCGGGALRGVSRRTSCRASLNSCDWMCSLNATCTGTPKVLTCSPR